MPNTPSLKNRRVYEALRRKGMPKSQAARISNAQVKKEALAIPPTGANALFNSMGIANRRRRCTCALTTKAAGPPGEKIAPGITRIRGNLCNVHGRYGPCDASGAPRKGAKPPKTDAQRAAERTQHQAERQAETTRQQAVNLTKVADDTGLGDDLANLDQFSAGEPIRPEDEETLIKQGVMERGTDGAARVTEQGRVLLNAAKRGDSQRARDALSRGRDQVSASASRATARQERTRAAAERTQGVAARRAAAQAKREAAKKKPAKASASGSKKPTAQAKPPAKVAARRAGRSAAPSVGSSSGGSSAPAKPTAPKPPAAAKPAIAPALRDAAQALSEGAEVTDEQVQQLITNGLVKLNRNGDPILTAAGLRATMKAQSATVLTVFKDARGDDRWLAITTTAYEDKDTEWISCDALKSVVAFGDKTKERGTLRYWHVPGLDFGTCDFQATTQEGRLLVESGVCYSPMHAAIVRKAAARGWQMSPGFIHPAGEPADGVYDHILIFERSFVPPGRAANPWTRLMTKETISMVEEKQKTLADLAGDQQVLATLLATRQTDKEAQERAAVYKDAPDWAQALFTRFDALEATVKAFPPAAAPVEGSPEEESAETPEEEALEPDAADDGGGMDDQAFASMIAQSVVQAITPLLDLEKKMAGHMADLKTHLGGISAQKEAAQALEAQRVSDLEAKLKELTGDLPDSVLRQAGGVYRASEASSTLLTEASAAKLKEQVQQIPPGLSEAAEIGAYQLIFGNQ